MATARQRVALGAGLAAVLAFRLAQVRSLELPAWVDSVHHALLVRILLEQGRLPDTWAPYLPDVPFYYHFGFHLTAAALAWITGWTGLELGRAVLVTGQLWQAAVAAGVALVAHRLTGSPMKALTALLLVGFVSPMPGYYVGWGRYTLLAGMGLLCFAMASALGRGRVTLALLVAATAVTHYFAFVLLMAFLAALLLATPERRRRLELLTATGAGVIVSLPWLLRVWTASQAQIRAPQLDGVPGAASVVPVLPLLGPGRNYVLLALAALGWVLLARRAHRGILAHRAAGWALLAWTAGLAALLGPWQLGPFRPDHAAIVFFLPTVLLAADAIVDHLALPAAVVVALVAWGLVEGPNAVRAELRLADGSDRRALAWIAGHTAPEAAFLIDVEPWMGIWRGRDGGWWIMPLTGRRTVLPPVAYGWGPPELAGLVRAHAERLYRAQQAPPGERCGEVERLMDESGAEYYYSRARPGTCSSLEAVYRDGDLAVYRRRAAS